MLPITLTVGPLATADADGICETQTPLAAGALTIDGVLATGGVATLDVARRVLVTSVGDDSGITFRITGTNADGNPIREVLAGPNATTAYTVQDFKTVTEVYVSDATADAVTVGTNGVASSPWKLTNAPQQAVSNIAWDCAVSGTVNYGIEWTLSQVNDNQNTIGSSVLGNYPSVPVPNDLTAISNKAAAANGTLATPILAWRAKVNSGTGSVTVRAIESGVNEG